MNMKPRAKKRSTKRSLLDKALVQFVICTVILLLVATPLFYLLTKHFYAEDMIDIIEAVKQGEPIPSLDLEEDILQGILISGILGIAITLTMRFITSRLWKPFDATLQKAEQFRLENGQLPDLPDSDVKEFEQLNHTLLSLMQNNLNSYRVQKEFTENASHELQTPLAIIQSKLDLFLQQPELSKPVDAPEPQSAAARQNREQPIRADGRNRLGGFHPEASATNREPDRKPLLADRLPNTQPCRKREPHAIRKPYE